MDNAYGAIFLFVFLTIGFAVGMLIMAHMLGPRRRTPVKLMPYESGMDPVGDARQRFDIRFYLVAIEFLVFDVELLFLYPWAVATGGGREPIPGLGEPVFWGAMFFLALLIAGFAYSWRKGVFQWR